MNKIDSSMLDAAADFILDTLDINLRPIRDRLSQLEQELKALNMKSGEKGDKGDAGERGEKGADGLPGEKGERGERGEKGADGIDGERGDPGPRGEKGEPGQKGDKGDPGPAGTIGLKGEKGDKGDKGDRGETGNPGVIGKQGERGERGDRGGPGPAGSDGQKGEKGDRGEPGQDALKIEILPKIDPLKSYPRGTYACHEGGLVHSFRNTVPDENITAGGWEILVRGVAEREMVMEPDNRTFRFRERLTGDKWKETVFSLPVLIYRYTYSAKMDYRRGDAVTWNGSVWHCEVDNPNTGPGKEDGNWKLMVKHGVDGKAGKQGPEGPPGKDGKNGRDGKDLTQLGPDGSRF